MCVCVFAGVMMHFSSTFLRITHVCRVPVFFACLLLHSLYNVPIFRAPNGKEVVFDIVFGPAYKGIPLAAVVCAALFQDFGVDAGFAYNRKEAKNHGEGGMLVGAALKGKRVLIVDDVITAGTAFRESMELLTAVEAKAVGVVIALDRAEKRSLEDPISAVQAVTRDFAIPVVSIINLPQLQTYLEFNPSIGEDFLANVSAYRLEYGV